MSNHYDYIITGAGCAGSSLLIRMMKEPFFAKKKILVIERLDKNANDRTWCYWEKNDGLFEPIVYHQWSRLSFLSEKFSETFHIDPYRYKMIRGIDLYNYVREETRRCSNIEWLHSEVKQLQTIDQKVIVKTEGDVFTADYVFNSIPFPNEKKATDKYHTLLQHFTGWLIQTKESVFDPAVATFMDFRVSQKQGTTFIYLLPVSADTALVEYTLFTKNILPAEKYDEGIKNYISSYFTTKEYTVLHRESGAIPMTNRIFPLQEGRIIQMGIVGGQVKGSSGYAFQFIQKRAQKIVDLLKRNKAPFCERTFNDRKFSLYDSVLLNVLCNKKMNGDEIFARIFANNPPERVLQFLDNESSLWSDMKLMRTMPSSIFLPAALQELFK